MAGYDPARAVAYATRWWDGRNPRFRSFPVDCTNFVSQCLWAGGWPMVHGGRRDRGWWYEGDGGAADRWSFSWAVAHSLRWYLAEARGAAEVRESADLRPGDVICYDFTDDGRWEHTAIVTATRNGEPLVSAHTYDVRDRHWSYRDSPAYTPQIRYRFYHIE